MVREWLSKLGRGKAKGGDREVDPQVFDADSNPEFLFGDEGEVPLSSAGDLVGETPEAPVEKSEKKERRKRKGKTLSQEAEYIDTGVIGIGRAKYAVGFAWSNRNPDMTVREQVEEITSRVHVNAKGEALRYDLLVDASRMGSLGLSEAQSSGQAPGMPALISCLPEATVGARWLGAFRINGILDAWWIGSIRDGKVFEDQIVLGRHAAEEIFHQNLEAPGWETVIAPPEWAIPDSSDLRLAEIIDPSSGIKVRHLTPLRANLPRIILLGALGVGAIGMAWAWQDMKAREAEELARLRREAENAVVLKPQDHPWFDSTPVTDFVSSCQAAIERAIFLVPGWEAQPISCTVDKGRGVVATGWTRNGGRISWLNGAMPEDFPKPVLEDDGMRASLSVSFDVPVDPNAVARQPWDGPAIEAHLRARFQTLGLEITIEESRENRKERGRDRDKGAGSRKDIPRPVFKSHDLGINVSAGIDEVSLLLRDVPALVPQALIYNVATSSWDLMAKAYHPPIIPGEQP